MNNEQIDFNSYVFKKYYQPKGKVVQSEVKGDNKLEEITEKGRQSKKVNEVKKSAKERKALVETGEDDNVNRKIIDQVNEEISKAMEDQSSLRKEVRRKVIQFKEKEETVESIKSVPKNGDNLMNPPQAPAKINDISTKQEFLDDYQLAKLEKEKEKRKKMEYAKILHDHIEAEKQYKAEMQLNKKGKNKEELNTLIEPSIPPSYPISIPKAPQDTQQFITTYANFLSDFCDTKMERYQNTQMLFKPYEKMLNDMVDGKINELVSQSQAHENENRAKTKHEMRFEKDSIEEKIKHSQVNSIEETNDIKRPMKMSLRKTILKRENQGSQAKSQKFALVKGRLPFTAETRMRPNKNGNPSFIEKRIIYQRNNTTNKSKRKDVQIKLINRPQIKNQKKAFSKKNSR